MARKRRKNDMQKNGNGADGARPDPSAAGTSERDTKKNDPERPAPMTRAWLMDWIKTIAFAVIIFLFLRTFIIESFVISSGSMEETMLVGDFLLVNKMGLGSRVPGTGIRVPGYSQPNRGDIVVFRADHAPGLDIVKRTIGLPGDTLSMKDGVLFRNGEAQDEPYVQRDPSVPDQSDASMVWQLEHLLAGVDRTRYRPTRDNWGPLVVPEERYFMMGDNREHSLDSRFWGLVERDKMKGKPFFVYYSYDGDAIKPFPWVLAMRPGRIGPSPH
jgi:signal peptidase I